MARDAQAALVALNRFGFGARGGASGDLINASSDPRGFVKAELARPNGVLLEAPGLQSTPQLGRPSLSIRTRSSRRARLRRPPRPLRRRRPRRPNGTPGSAAIPR